MLSTARGIAARSIDIAATAATEASCLASSVTRLARPPRPAALTRPDPDDLRATRLREHPVMLVHGLGANKSSFTAMAGRLRRAGFTVYGVDYSCRGYGIAGCGAQLEQAATRLQDETGCRSAHVVAHSLGGVVLRWAVTHTWMGDWVRTAITLGSPHRGTPTAQVAPSALPGIGALLSELRPEEAPADVVGTGRTAGPRWVAIAAEHDWIVPPGYALLPESDGARNVLVHGCGHLGLTTNRSCMRVVIDELTQLDEHALPLPGPESISA